MKTIIKSQATEKFSPSERSSFHSRKSVSGNPCVYYSQVLEVYSGGALLGSVTQEWSLCRPTFYVRDATGNPVLVIKGPLIRFCVEVAFKVRPTLLLEFDLRTDAPNRPNYT